jgi:hypothetical protein
MPPPRWFYAAIAVAALVAAASLAVQARPQPDWRFMNDGSIFDARTAELCSRGEDDATFCLDMVSGKFTRIDGKPYTIELHTSARRRQAERARRALDRSAPMDTMLSR